MEDRLMNIKNRMIKIQYIFKKNSRKPKNIENLGKEVFKKIIIMTQSWKTNKKEKEHYLQMKCSFD